MSRAGSAWTVSHDIGSASLRVIEGETDAVAARLQTFADAGAHEVMLIVDPPDAVGSRAGAQR